ncbi:hypothetical protein [Novosphingobium sp. BL-52-GroH]|uniref:hypothetical protein n=1 Tax=Novosphingobium sp. BL-52-GroH TaxID=3349877 RepID=UPI0038504118
MVDMRRRSLLKASATAGLAGTIAVAPGAISASAEVAKGSTLTLGAFGAKGGGADDADAITALNDYVCARVERISDAYRSTFGFVQSGLVVDLVGIHCFSNTLVIYPGVDYRLPTGSTLVGCKAGQTIVRTASKAELGTIGAIYGSSASSMRGGGCIDGAELASIGFLADTVTDCSRFEFTVVRCSHRRYRTTCSGGAGGSEVTVSGSIDARVGDTVQIPEAPDEFFSVVEVRGHTLKLGRTLRRALDGAALVHRACGLSGIDAQITRFDVQASRNDVGWSFGANADGIHGTDLRVTGKAEFNMIGLIFIQGDGRFRDVTLMHNFDRELVYVSGIASCFDGIYLETMSDAQAKNVPPPVNDKVDLQRQPLVDVRGGRMTMRDVNWPNNPTSTSFRRLLRNRGDTLVSGMVGSTVPLLHNPADPDDISPFEEVAGSRLTIRDVRGWTNIRSDAALRKPVRDR